VCDDGKRILRNFVATTKSVTSNAAGATKSLPSFEPGGTLGERYWAKGDFGQSFDEEYLSLYEWWYKGKKGIPFQPEWSDEGSWQDRYNEIFQCLTFSESMIEEKTVPKNVMVEIVSKARDEAVTGIQTN
jgi:hypothetical protein